MQTILQPNKSQGLTAVGCSSEPEADQKDIHKRVAGGYLGQN